MQLGLCASTGRMLCKTVHKQQTSTGVVVFTDSGPDTGVVIHVQQPGGHLLTPDLFQQR